MSGQSLDIFEGRIDRIRWQTRPDGDGVWEESGRVKDDSTHFDSNNWENALPLGEIEKTGGIALERLGFICTFRSKALIRHLWWAASQMASSGPFLLSLPLCGTPPTGWSVWPIEDGKGDDLWLLRLSDKCHRPSAWTFWNFTLEEASSHSLRTLKPYWEDHVERTWGLPPTHSTPMTCKQATLGVDPPPFALQDT